MQLERRCKEQLVHLLFNSQGELGICKAVLNNLLRAGSLTGRTPTVSLPNPQLRHICSMCCLCFQPSSSSCGAACIQVFCHLPSAASKLCNVPVVQNAYKQDVQLSYVGCKHNMRDDWFWPFSKALMSKHSLISNLPDRVVSTKQLVASFDYFTSPLHGIVFCSNCWSTTRSKAFNLGGSSG